MNYLLFDSDARENLLPFTHTRPVADIRCGVLTMRERWEKLLSCTTGTLTKQYMKQVFPGNTSGDCMLINAAVFASKDLYEAIAMLHIGEVLRHNELIIAIRASDITEASDWTSTAAGLTEIHYTGEIYSLKNNWDIFSFNDLAIREDFALLTEGRTSAPVPEGVTVSGHDQLFIEEGARIYPGCIINASTGPVYIAADAEILEGSMLRGPLALCQQSVVKMGAKIYGATTIGPGSKVGGEINNAVFFANSNKSHDGYLGNSVVGEWCNLGADTNTSNLKNNYDEVKVWHEASGSEIATGLVFCGLMMGDHSKCGINTMFNTGTVVGVSCNIYGGGFPSKNIPSFSWGGNDGFTVYRFDKAMETANRMMGRRSKSLSDAELAMYRHIYDNRVE